jgi:photosystem II stability/assembly factor-like uncharacterized protein
MTMLPSFTRRIASTLVLGVLPVLTLGAGALGAQSLDADRIAAAVRGLGLRAVGPAVAGGRIADIAVHPGDASTWYVAVGSGGVWKTVNAGTTWTPVFDDQASYSIGTVALDPGSPETVWVGTGENVSGRHVAWGDGVYRSLDGGRTWRRMGLERSEHIGRILIDPRDGDRVFVAAEGPLWSSGGDRGVYRSTDGGETWTHVLAIDDDTGVTDLEFHPTDPDVLYAAAYQRRRHVWSFLAGGPSSGIYKSTDGGESWRRIETGLPRGDMGKIGLAVTPADPERVYATIEAAAGERGFYRSLDRGESWERRNGYVSGGTGPHYYQEIEASPTDPDLVYQMDVFVQVSRDGGATFDNLGNGREKHSDDHALWIDPADGRHLLVGSDAGLYETFDEGLTWRHFPNMPISQFYKVALSEREPYYEILGGAQDLGTLHGPARTTTVEGVRNQDWYVPLGADGYGVAFDPRDPDVFYAMTQNGNLIRTDRRSEEGIGIQPQPAPGDPPERWNWDAPILISPHDADRLYFGSQRVWRSDDRGDSWRPVSGDLTLNQNRYELEVMGRVWSVDALYDNGAMSRYSTLTAITESPLAEGVLYTGSDDGLVQASEDGGATWRRAATPPGLPARSFVNDVEASLHDADAVFVVADNHKAGDFTPYLYESRDRGRSWRSIRGDLPDGTIVWAIEQDHVEPDLLFAGTEFGLYFSPDRGAHWIELGAGVPTISFRDVKLQRRDDDVVGATFGRGFYVLDDYGPLREMASGALAAGATLFGVRDAWWYVPSVPGQAAGLPTRGSTDWRAPNPPHGPVFTYHLAEVPTTARAARQAVERGLRASGEDVPFPGFDRLRDEALERAPGVHLLVRDAEGRPVRRIEGPAREGLHRVAWDMRGPPPDPVSLGQPGFRPPWVTDPRGALVAPGRYQVELLLVTSEGATPLDEPRTFELEPLPTTPPGTDLVAVAAFQQEVSELMRQVNGASQELGRVGERLRHMRAALIETPRADLGLHRDMDALERRVAELQVRLTGDPARRRLNEFTEPGLRSRLGTVMYGHFDTRQTPTATQRRDVEIARTEFEGWRLDLAGLIDGELARLEAALEAAGAPWTPGRRLPGGGG